MAGENNIYNDGEIICLAGETPNARKDSVFYRKYGELEKVRERMKKYDSIIKMAEDEEEKSRQLDSQLEFDIKTVKLDAEKAKEYKSLMEEQQRIEKENNKLMKAEAKNKDRKAFKNNIKKYENELKALEKNKDSLAIEEYAKQKNAIEDHLNENKQLLQHSVDKENSYKRAAMEAKNEAKMYKNQMEAARSNGKIYEAGAKHEREKKKAFEKKAQQYRKDAALVKKEADGIYNNMLKEQNQSELMHGVKAFEKLMKDNPVFSKNTLVPEIAKEYGTMYTQKIDGKKYEMQDPTKLFYIEGKSMDSYLKDTVKNYNRLSPSQKQFQGMAAVTYALSQDKSVDVKCFVTNDKGQCEPKMFSLVHPTCLDRVNDKAWRDKTKQRTDAILKADAKKDNKILKGIGNAVEKLRDYLPKMPKLNRTFEKAPESRQRTDVAAKEMGTKAPVRTSSDPKLVQNRTKTAERKI